MRRHLRANVVGYLALFVALGGTGAWAADRITSKDVARNAVLSKHIKNGQVKTPDLANGGVTAAKLACNGNGPQDKMVRAGSVCIDRYESSIWTKKTGGQRITGTIPCSPDGQDCKGKIFALSVKGVPPRTNITWFQAQQALANSGKRLATNAEWQAAVAGTPDSTDCNVNSGAVQNTGANVSCTSDWGANDMVGNVEEMVADWVPFSASCPGWGALSDDAMCFSGAVAGEGPGVLIRGGTFSTDTFSGPLAVSAEFDASLPSGPNVGFRGAR